MSLPCLSLPHSLLQYLLHQSQHAGKAEICGLIAADDDSHWLYPMTNLATSPEQQFCMAPADLAMAFGRMRHHAQHLASLYHSHPAGEAELSRQDIAGHHYPQTPCLIVAPQARRGRWRAWQIIRQQASPMPIRPVNTTWQHGLSRRPCRHGTQNDHGTGPS